ncbi:peptide chain release factor H [Reichenbachiella ulvae]|uniref:Peptide chain release factor H n=1 Tax=Reichenbachiella ulvae TaxID=2980104 RepID=A0ABT3CQV8_9BACT|nr:peptide chain release factor H [Reichenbachiella ulvae]MCV9385943.1 peptide chain release factor H [Reichenbachiella ulvae]
MKYIDKRIIQITSGRGPAECCWVVAQVLKYLMDEAKTTSIKTTVLDRVKGDENGTLRSASLQLVGNNLDQFLSQWIGTIQWIGQSHYRRHHKRKNWFIGIKLMNVNGSLVFDEREVRFDFTRSSGPGGQHVNKVSTAVRAIHRPTSLMVFESNHRSQIQNKKEALRRLALLLEKKNMDQFKEQIRESWENHDALDRGNPIRVFKGSDFKSNYESKKYKSQRKSDKQVSIRRLEY